MTWDELEAEAPRLMAFIKVCGVRPDDGARVLGEHLWPLLNAFALDCGPDRVRLYSGIAEDLRPWWQGASVGRLEDLAFNSPWNGPLMGLDGDLRLSLFLMFGADFSLLEVAQVVRGDPSELATRLDHGLRTLDACPQAA